jgi:hypothetical protein
MEIKKLRKLKIVRITQFEARSSFHGLSPWAPLSFLAGLNVDAERR